METEAKRMVELIKYDRRMSQNDVADAIGISHSYISRLVGGYISLSKSMKQRIVDAFPDVSFEDNIVKEVFASECKQGVPYYNVDFCLGYDAIFNDQSKPEMYILSPLGCNADCWVSTRGNSMYPLISGGDIVAIREVGISSVMYGDVYAIVMKENRTIKRIRKGSSPNKWLLVPENTKDFDEQEIDISNVIKVFKVEAVAKPL